MRPLAPLLLLLALLAAGPGAAQPLAVPPGALAVRSGSTINVEIDYMVDDGPTGDGHSHRPTQAEMLAVVQMFACRGILLNVVIDDAIPHRPRLFRDPDDASNFFDFEDDFYPERTFLGIKNEHFDRGIGWHYAVFAHQYEDSDYQLAGSSGLAERPGDDFIVTLGSFDGQIGTAWDRAATFAHELGHNLGLRHTGAAALTGNHVPNLPSIMSYSYQLAGVRAALQCQGLAGASDEETLYKQLDYSGGQACTLAETALNEDRGMGIVPVDWNCDGSTGGIVASNVNGNDEDGGLCGVSGPLQTLSDYDEWSSLLNVTLLPKDAYESEDVACATAEEAAAFRARLGAHAARLGVAGGCQQPTPTVEACQSRRMVYLRNAGSLPAGTCRAPVRTLTEAAPFLGNGNILYAQPGSYPTTGTVIDEPVQILGPGGAVFGD